MLSSDSQSFRQRYIKIGLTLGSKLGKVLLEPMANLLASSPTVCVCVFVNFVSEVSKWAERLEHLLAAL